MTQVEHPELKSPLSLLEQWRDRIDGLPLREFLVTGYTLDLAFLERFCVPTARSLGARVTVIADSAQSLHDPVDVRFAGRAYQHGHVATQGAFHPKVAVLLGDEEVWVAIGSGNPTMSGWGHNHELWWVLRGALDRGPLAQAELGAWLSVLPEQVAMPSWIGQTVREIGRRVVPAEIDGTHVDVRVLGNLDVPLVEQLPAGPVAELRFAAPFFDPSGDAVRALLTRLPASRLMIGLQEGLTTYEGRTLVAAAGRAAEVEFRAVAKGRTMHGKLLEWTGVDGRAGAMVGSANITARALLRSVRNGGNCELVVVSPTARSLFPDGDQIAAGQVASHVSAVAEQATRAMPALHLLGCRRKDDGLLVEFVARRAVAVTIEASVDGSPDSWAVIATVPAHRVEASGGVSSALFDAPEIVSGVVRLVATIEGCQVESAPVFVTDTTRCRPRTEVGDVPKLRHDYDVDQIISDKALAARFNHDLLRLLELSRHRRSAVPAASGSREVNARAPEDRWQWFLDIVTHSLGPSITQLVFPGALAPTVVPQAGGWSVSEVGDETALADGENEDVIDQLGDQEPARRATVVPVPLRAQYRSWASRWVRAVSAPEILKNQPAPAQPVLSLRMTVGCLYLDLLAGGIWGAEETWREELADLVQALADDPAELGDTPEEGLAYLGSLIAVCLTVLLQDANLHGGTPADVVAKRAWDHGREYAVFADEEIISGLLHGSTQTDARVGSLTETLKIVELAREARQDPYAEARTGFESDGYEVASVAGAWVIRGDFRNTARLAARAVTEFTTSTGVTTALASNGRQATLMLHHDGLLIMTSSAVRQWRIYEIHAPITPFSKFSADDGIPPANKTRRLTPLPAEVARLVEESETDLAALMALLHAPDTR